MRRRYFCALPKNTQCTRAPVFTLQRGHRRQNRPRSDRRLHSAPLRSAHLLAGGLRLAAPAAVVHPTPHLFHLTPTPTSTTTPTATATATPTSYCHTRSAPTRWVPSCPQGAKSPSAFRPGSCPPMAPQPRGAVKPYRSAPLRFALWRFLPAPHARLGRSSCALKQSR
jgi:hypothetical protein